MLLEVEGYEEDQTNPPKWLNRTLQCETCKGVNLTIEAHIRINTASPKVTLHPDFWCEDCGRKTVVYGERFFHTQLEKEGVK